MREPAFWRRPTSWLSRLLMPLGAVYGAIVARRMQRTGIRAGVPVICVGNFTLGGAGKTPTVLALCKVLREIGEKPVVLSRGYGGKLRGPIKVDAATHSAAQVGDEPLMMAASLPVVVSRDRGDGVAVARSLGASVIVMDDGFQNPAVAKNVSLIVIDSDNGLGNGQVFPAGPLRAPLLPQLGRTDALLIVGTGNRADATAAAVVSQGKPVFRAQLEASERSVSALRGKRVLAFAGIGDPQRFFRTLRASGIDVAVEREFGDHHPYSQDELLRLQADASRDGLTLVSTEKDCARIGALGGQAEIIPFLVTLEFADVNALQKFATDRLFQARAREA